MFKTDFNIKYNQNNDFGYTLLADTDYPEHLQPLHKYLPFLPEEIVINKEKYYYVLF